MPLLWTIERPLTACQENDCSRNCPKMALTVKCGTALKQLYIYTNTCSTVRVNDELTSPITIDRDVKQGCTLSLTLFNNYSNDLVDCLNREAKGISFWDCKITFLLFADDLVILGDTPAALKKLLDAWCKCNGMVINPSKQKLYTLDLRKAICQTAFS